jgi:hypothetical protein
MMKTVLLWILGLSIAPVIFIAGCGPSDVSGSPEYGFSSFSGTVWKTKVKLAIGESSGTKYILAPRNFDPSNPEYIPRVNSRVLFTIPAGTEVRIDRLLKDNGESGGVWVTATVVDGTKPPFTVRVDNLLLANNVFISRAPTRDRTWTMNPDLLEKK